MGKSRWARTDRVMRWLHLYTGLFLAPWMGIYATSALCLNHGPWINRKFEIAPPEWEFVREVDFVPDDTFPRSPEEQARAILAHLDLEGAHRIQGKPNPHVMTIFRISGSGHWRVTWRRHQARLVVERQQPFSLLRLVHFLHFRCGYQQPYSAFIAWAVVVDAMAVSLWLWVVSGIYLWARRPRKRLLGGVCVIAGSLLFIGLTILLCR